MNKKNKVQDKIKHHTPLLPKVMLVTKEEEEGGEGLSRRGYISNF